MAKDRTKLDIDAAFADEVPISIPTGGGETVVREPLDLSVLEDEEASEEAPVAEAPVEENGLVNDVVQSAGSGVAKAANAFSSTMEDMGIPNPFVAGMNMLNRSSGPFKKDDAPAPLESKDVQVPVYKPQTIAGNITQGVTQFSVGMVGAGKVLKLGNVLQNGGKAVVVARGMVAGGAADVAFFDPTEERLSNLLEEYPSLSNPVTRYLQSDPEDSKAEGRFKNAIEGLVLGGAVEGLIASIKGVRRIRAAKATGGDKAAAEELVKVSDELEAASKAPEAPTEGAAKAAPVEPQAATVKPNVEPPEQSLKDYLIERINAPFIEHNYKSDFNIAKQSTTSGAKETIRLMSEAIAPEIDALKGGVQTFDKIKAMASRLGEDPLALQARMSSRAANAKTLAADVIATEEWMLSTARAISEEAKRVDNGISPDSTLLNQMMDSLSSTVADLKAVKTSAARATSVGRMTKMDGHSLEEIKALVAAGGDLDQVLPIVKGATGLKRALNVHNEVWINALLSGPKTHLVNATSNFLNTFLRPTEKMLGGQFRQGLGEFLGMARSIKDSVAMAAKSFSLEESILDPQNLKTEGPRFSVSSGNFKLNPKTFAGASIDWIGKAVRLPTRMLMTADELFKQINYRANVYSRAAREGTEKGLNGRDLAEYIETRFQSAFDGTGKGLDDTALQEARIATFTEDLNPESWIGKQSKIANQHPGMRLIVPFIRTPTNIVKQLGQRTPFVNLAMDSYWAEIKAGGGRAAAMKGKWATGGMLWGAGALLASQGKLTGRGPESPDERAALMSTGWRPYSFKSDDGTYLDYSRIDPSGMALGLAADFTEAKGYMSDADAEALATAMTAALARNLTNKTYLRGVTEALDALSQPDRKAAHWIQSRAGSYMPSAAKQVSDLTPGNDDTMREVRSMMDAIYARTPGLSQTLAPKRNLLGEPIKYPPGLGPDSISPFAMSKDLDDPVKDELARLSYGFKMPSEKTGNVDLTKYKNAKGQDAYDRLLELRSIERKGRYTLAERLSLLIKSDSYERLPDGNDMYSSKKLQKVQEVLGEYHIATLKRLRKEFPEVDEAIRTDQRNAKVVKRKGTDALAPLLGQ